MITTATWIWQDEVANSQLPNTNLFTQNIISNLYLLFQSLFEKTYLK
jgi:hypothetical protein